MVRKPPGRPPRVPRALSDMQAQAWTLRRMMADLMAVQAMLGQLITPPRDPFGEAEAMLRAPDPLDPLDALGVPTVDELAEMLEKQ